MADSSLGNSRKCNKNHPRMETFPFTYQIWQKVQISGKEKLFYVVHVLSVQDQKWKIEKSYVMKKKYFRRGRKFTKFQILKHAKKFTNFFLSIFFPPGEKFILSLNSWKWRGIVCFSFQPVGNSKLVERGINKSHFSLWRGKKGSWWLHTYMDNGGGRGTQRRQFPPPEILLSTYFQTWRRR